MINRIIFLSLYILLSAFLWGVARKAGQDCAAANHDLPPYFAWLKASAIPTSSPGPF